MTQYVAPLRGNVPQLSRRICVSLETERDSGVKHAYIGDAGHGYSFNKGPTDYLFTVSLTLQNVADGSRYFVEDTADGTDIATGLQSGTGDIVITGIGYAGSSRTLRLRVRKSSSAPYYKAYEVTFSLGANGASVPVAQIPDP